VGDAGVVVLGEAVLVEAASALVVVAAFVVVLDVEGDRLSAEDKA
jgi:hypothetical protein